MIELVSYARLLEQTALLEEYAAECSIPEIGKATPNPAIYAAMETAGLLQCFMAWHMERVVGFASVLLPVMPHYSVRVSTVESIFITQSARNTGIGGWLMKAIEGFSRDHGCAVVLWSAPAGGQFERVLSRNKRYRQTNSVFACNP